MLIHLFFYAKSPDDLVDMKNYIEDCCMDINYASEIFNYPMDLLDHVNTVRPEHCCVFFDSDSDPLALEIAQKIHCINPKYRFNLICDTAFDAEEMYSMGVTYFVKKPYLYPNISKCAENVLDFYSDIQQRFVKLKNRQGTDILRCSEIRYVMSDKRKVIFCCDSKECEYYYKLDEIENMLDDSFIRCHQSYIVNMKQIKLFVEDGVLLYDDTFVPISRKNHFSVRRRYMTFVAGDKMLEL